MVSCEMKYEMIIKYRCKLQRQRHYGCSTHFGKPWKPLAPTGSDESDKMATKGPDNR